MKVHFFGKRDQLQVQDRRHLKKVFLWRSTSSTMRPTTGTGSEAHQQGLLKKVLFFDNEANYRYRMRGTSKRSSYRGPLLRQRDQLQVQDPRNLKKVFL
jgi:hypothetical protein